MAIAVFFLLVSILRRYINAFAGQPVDKWDPTAIQSMAWSRMEHRVAII